MVVILYDHNKTVKATNCLMRALVRTAVQYQPKSEKEKLSFAEAIVKDVMTVCITEKNRCRLR